MRMDEGIDTGPIVAQRRLAARRYGDRADLEAAAAAWLRRAARRDSDAWLDGRRPARAQGTGGRDADPPVPAGGWPPGPGAARRSSWSVTSAPTSRGPGASSTRTLGRVAVLAASTWRRAAAGRRARAPRRATRAGFALATGDGRLVFDRPAASARMPGEAVPTRASESPRRQRDGSGNRRPYDRRTSIGAPARGPDAPAKGARRPRFVADRPIRGLLHARPRPGAAGPRPDRLDRRGRGAARCTGSWRCSPRRTCRSRARAATGSSRPLARVGGRVRRRAGRARRGAHASRPRPMAPSSSGPAGGRCRRWSIRGRDGRQAPLARVAICRRGRSNGCRWTPRPTPASGVGGDESIDAEDLSDERHRPVSIPRGDAAAAPRPMRSPAEGHFCDVAGSTRATSSRRSARPGSTIDDTLVVETSTQSLVRRAIEVAEGTRLPQRRVRAVGDAAGRGFGGKWPLFDTLAAAAAGSSASPSGSRATRSEDFAAANPGQPFATDRSAQRGRGRPVHAARGADRRGRRARTRRAARSRSLACSSPDRTRGPRSTSRRYGVRTNRFGVGAYRAPSATADVLRSRDAHRRGRGRLGHRPDRASGAGTWSRRAADGRRRDVAARTVRPRCSTPLEASSAVAGQVVGRRRGGGRVRPRLLAGRNERGRRGLRVSPTAACRSSPASRHVRRRRRVPGDRRRRARDRARRGPGRDPRFGQRPAVARQRREHDHVLRRAGDPPRGRGCSASACSRPRRSSWRSRSEDLELAARDRAAREGTPGAGDLAREARTRERPRRSRADRGATRRAEMPEPRAVGRGPRRRASASTARPAPSPSSRITSSRTSGRVLNAALVEGQQHGAAAQGIGWATMERLVHDANGQLLSWHVPGLRAAACRGRGPPRRRRAWRCPPPDGPLGAKGIGEAPVIAGAAAVANAIAAATGAACATCR